MRQKKSMNGLLGLLSEESTNESRNLLKKYNMKDASNINDLTLKLAELYKNCPDKIVIEKEFAAIHPHKEWIMKRIESKPETHITAPDGIVMTEDSVKDILKKYIGEGQQGLEFSNMNGRYSNCSGMSNSCGCSGFSGESASKPKQNETMVIAITALATIAIVGIFLHYKK